MGLVLELFTLEGCNVNPQAAHCKAQKNEIGTGLQGE